MAIKRKFKSKKKLSSTRATYRPWKEWQTGDIIIGIFKGSQTDNYDKPNWLVEIVEAFFPSKPKLAAKLKGQILGLNSNGKLDKAMEGVEPGDMVQVEYKGMSTIEKGKYKGKDAHDVEVDLVEEDDGSEDEEEVDEEDEDESEDSDDDDDDDEEDL